jgi:subtilisin family serine protease
VQSGSTTFSWHWRNGETDDGNWGLKAIRMPPVWTILDRVRKADPNRVRPRLVFLDSGFGTHGHLVYNQVLGGMPTNPPVANCEYSHGTHVAGIAGALWGKGRGIDGIVPDAKIDAVPVDSELVLAAAEAGIVQPVNQRAILFTSAVDSLVEFVDVSPLQPGEKWIINASLGYNWSSVGFKFGKNPEQDDNVKAHILNTSRTIQRLATRLGDKGLIVAAAGNDSEGTVPPDSAEWATPFGFAGIYSAPNFQPSKNIMVVEAFGRDGQRASFSNGGGHVSAPGVDIMSTLAGVNDTYGTCTGTSQAAPHVAALAAILLELDPSKTPAEIIDIIKSSAVPAGPNQAPRIDALNAVLKLSKDNLRYLTDLNGDGKVDEADLEIFKNQLAVIADANVNGTKITVDLNGSGDINDDQRCWPLINFNGAGKVAIGDVDSRNVGGVMRTDLQVMEAAWTDTNKSFKTALAEVGLEPIIAQFKASNASPLVASVAASAPPALAPCR